MNKYLIYCFIIILASSCSSSRTIRSSEDGRIRLTFVQVNDVYEIAPLEGGRTGGFARIAHIKKKYQDINPNTFLVMAGDFSSPSVYNSLQYEGKRIRGRQMIETMNAAGTDLAVFGNHEFDISESEFQSRLNESAFRYISSNSFHKKGSEINPFIKKTLGKDEPVPETYIMTVSDADGTTAKVGFIGITIPFNKAAYVSYTDPLSTAVKLYNRIKDSCDAIIAITHQLISDDIALARQLPGLAMIIGGHEHDRRYHREGNVIIAKAHANAKSAYILQLEINKNKKNHVVTSELKMLNQDIPFDPVTDSVVKKWTDIAEKNYASIGFDARKTVRSSGDPLEGRDAEIRSRSTNLSRIIVSSMEKASPQAEVAVVNAGSIRLDDILQMPITQYDILRTLPFGGNIAEVDMKGELLSRLLAAGKNNKGTGGFLHYSPKITVDPSGIWKINGLSIQPATVYRVAMTDFLLTGGEANMAFLKKDNPAITTVHPVATQITDPRSDIRLAVIRYLKTQPAATY